MKILFVAPLPPPISGHSLASKVLLDELTTAHDVEVVNLGVGSRNDGTVTGRRVMEVGKVLIDVCRKRKNAGAIYITVSESFVGNLKDLFIYALCVGKLSKVYVHLHGGSIGKLLFDRHATLRKLNALFLKRFAGAIVCGASHVDIFANMIGRERTHVVPNCADDSLFVSEEAVGRKFAGILPLRVLYMGSLTPGKGFNELVDAFLALRSETRNLIRVDLAGKCESESERTRFLTKISGVDHIQYHGVVDGVMKQRLFSSAHVLCLPTSFLEGQPISILEAYAAGCVVLTTLNGGIPDIFTPGVNGFAIREKSAESIRMALESLLSGTDHLLDIALGNRRAAVEKYRMDLFGKTIRELLESTAQPQI